MHLLRDQSRPETIMSKHNSTIAPEKQVITAPRLVRVKFLLPVDALNPILNELGQTDMASLPYLDTEDPEGQSLTWLTAFVSTKYLPKTVPAAQVAWVCGYL